MIITRRAAARAWGTVVPAAVLGMLLLSSGCAPVVIGAGAAVGVTAAQERGVKGALDDTAVRADINDRWFKDDHAAYSDVNLQVQEGRVL